MVYVRVHVQPQSLLRVAWSSWLTVKLPQSLNSSLISPSSFRPVVSAFAKQLSWFSISEGQLLASTSAGAMRSPPLNSTSTTKLLPHASLIVYGYFTLQLQLLSLTTISLPRVAVTTLQLSSYRAAMSAPAGRTVRSRLAKQAFCIASVGRTRPLFRVGAMLSFTSTPFVANDDEQPLPSFTVRPTV